jgi:class 3 adenylate cyclase
MQPKIAAILAADIAGYSKLVAEDEEETLRRLPSYRAVFADFVPRFSGQIFDTADHVVLARFPSAVEAVRCAVEVQESLRTRNLAYPASRKMACRIGITIDDVIERDGNLLGDGVNIARRLSELAQPGGLCIARNVHEQVANKLSVEFVDIGAQNINDALEPINAYALGFSADARRHTQGKQNKKGASSAWRVAIAAASAAAVVVATFYFFGRSSRVPAVVGELPETIATVEPPAPPPPTRRQPEMLVPEIVPFILDRQRVAIRTGYMSAPDHKAIAISFVRAGFITGQKDEEAAKAAALAACQRASDASLPGQHCDLYAVGNTVVYGRGQPPMPPQPWLVRDSSVETPFAVESVPLVNTVFRGNVERNYPHGRQPKALAVSPQGLATTTIGQESLEEAVRRALEVCAGRAGFACVIVAVDDVFVVPIPATMKAVGLFRAAGKAVLAPQVRDDVARRLGEATGGWPAVAVGVNGRPGLMVRAGSEQEAINGALADCGRRDQACRVIAIGPFIVEPK